MDKLYNNATFYLKRKYDLFNVLKTWVPQKGYPERPRKVRKDFGIPKPEGFWTEEGLKNKRSATIASNKKRAKMNIEKAKEVRKLFFNENLTIMELSKKFDVSVALLSNIINNKWYTEENPGTSKKDIK